jgi:hypothetical protein
MSASDKEKILTELREYHVNAETALLASDSTTRLKTEFTEIEDKIINMILSYVNGKAEFVDFSSEVEEFKKKVLAQTTETPEEKEDQKYLLSKLEQLKNILDVASKSIFKLRPQRYTRTTPRGMQGITTTQNEK